MCKNYNHYKHLSLIIVLMILVVSLVGCTGKKAESNDELVTSSPKESSFTVKDDFGNEVSFEKAPERIISLAPSNTEILFALGLDDKVVGVTTFDDYPEEVLEIEKIGDFTGINLEKIIELNPDLVISYGPGDGDENARLREAGIEVIGFEPESIDEIIETINKIGQLTGKESEAKALTESMIKKRDEIINKIKNAPKVKVFYEIWHDPLMAAGPGSFMDHLMTLAGGDNIAKDAKDEYPQFDLEQLIERNPDVYLTSADMPEKTPEAMMARPGFENISAMKSGRVYVLEPNIVSRPGPRIVEALEIVAKAIHPEIFK